MHRFVITFPMLLLLVACGSQADYDLAYVRENKCKGYLSDDSPAYKDCVERELSTLRATRRIRLPAP